MTGSFKRFLAYVSATALLLYIVPIFGLGVIAQAGISFSDVSSLNPHYAAISSLVDQEILQGYDDGTFKPDQEVNRAEAVKIVLLGMGLEVDESSVAGLVFSDVAEDSWFYEEVGTAVSMGIVNGYDDNTFLPGQTVNRAEAMKMLTLAAGVGELSSDGSSPFADVGSDAWYSGYAAYARTWNVEPPQTNGLWEPGENVTRANISEMVYRMQLVQENGVAFEESTNWLRKDFTTVDVSLKVPFGWNYKQDGVAAAWILDEDNGQMSLLTPMDNGGSLLITRYSNSNRESYSTLFSRLGYNASGGSVQTTINGYPTLILYHNENGGIAGTYFQEWYVFLDNETLVHFLGLRGEGAYGDFLEDYLESIVISIEYEPDGEENMSIEDVLESLRSAIQVDGVGTDMMSLLDDWELIETDSIGIGTGPVDYYYSPSAVVTVKYERSYDVILDIQDGQTTAF
jgi:hypothetical protein